MVDTNVRLARTVCGTPQAWEQSSLLRYALLVNIVCLVKVHKEIHSHKTTLEMNNINDVM